MGGFGSGRYLHWWRPRKKTTVEDCNALDANRWMREGVLKAGVRHAGSWRWTVPNGREESIDYEVNTLDPASSFVRLIYWSIPFGPQEKETFDYRVRLTTMQPQFGGIRWWFVCPLVVRGFPCNRRVGKLYMPPGGRYFGCRHCHKLNYASSQDSHMDNRVLRERARVLGVDLTPSLHSLQRDILRLKRTLCGPRAACRSTP